MGLAPEVLPVVRVLTLCLVVVVRQVGAPFCFEIVHVEIGIFLHLMD